MYDILCEMFKNPGSAFSPLPFWFLNDKMDRDELVRQIDAFHKKGVDGFVLHPRMGFDERIDYMSPAYLDLVELCVATAAKKRMMVVLYDEAMYPSGSAHGMVARANPLFAARALYAVPSGEESLASGEEVVASASLDGREYRLVLGFTGGTIRGIYAGEDDGMPDAPLAADLLNPDAVDCFLANTHEVYHRRLGQYFGGTVIGIFTDEPSLTGRGVNMREKLPWSYGLLEEFLAEGGDEDGLLALLLSGPVGRGRSGDAALSKEATEQAALLDTAEGRRKRRETEEIYRRTVKKRLGLSYYSRLSDWCRRHGIALMGHPAESDDCEYMKYFDVPGQDLVFRMVEHGKELVAPDSVMAKCSSDAARHLGAGRNANECFGVCGAEGNPWDFTGTEMMRILNFLFARGVNMIIPHAFYYSLRTPLQSNERPPDVGPNSVFWPDYRRIAGYIKRMSWLNAMNDNNPAAAVLSENGFMPVKSVAGLYENGWTFNYLTAEDFLERAHLHDGTIAIDRYSYRILLVDGRMRLNPALVLKLGRFVTEGGLLYRGNDFLSYVEKHAKKRSYFEPEPKSAPNAKRLRFVHLTKSGYPFFLLFNEGDETLCGFLVTDQSGACERFDPFTGGRTPWKGELCRDGIRYPVRVKPNTVEILGFNTDVLPELGENPREQVMEMEALPVSAGPVRYSYHPAEGKRCVLSFASVRDACRILVNGKEAAYLCFAPWEADVTPYLTEGENVIAVEVVESMANRYGNPVPAGVFGCAAEVRVLV